MAADFAVTQTVSLRSFSIFINDPQTNSLRYENGSLRYKEN
jgi:hypothetical protein